MRKNIASIQFLRFVAATLVVLHHTANATDQYFTGSLSKGFLHITDFGASGVDIFFVISGLVMVYTSFKRKDDAFSASRFITKRIIRIYPIYFIYAALYLLFYYFFAHGKNLSVVQLIGSFALFPGYADYIIGPGWTLSFEIYFYLCFSIAMMLGLVRGMFILSFFFVSAIACHLVLDTSQPVIHVMTSSLLLDFLAGAWIGYAMVTSIRIGNKLANTMLAFSFVGFFAGIAFGYNHFPSLITWGIPSTLLVAGLVFRENNGHAPLLIKSYSFLGDSSYSLYLLHIVLIDAIIFFMIYLDDRIRTQISEIGPLGMTIFCAVITSLCIIVAYIFYELLERVVVGRLQEMYRRRFAALPAI
jgi:exopolysaccharide production protein ExoZ